MNTTAQQAAIAQLKAAMAACRAAGLQILVQGNCPDYMHPAIAAGYAEVGGNPCVAIGFDDEIFLDCVEDDTMGEEE